MEQWSDDCSSAAAGVRVKVTEAIYSKIETTQVCIDFRIGAALIATIIKPQSSWQFHRPTLYTKVTKIDIKKIKNMQNDYPAYCTFLVQRSFRLLQNMEIISQEFIIIFSSLAEWVWYDELAAVTCDL